MTEARIGVLGGMGPLATADFLTKLVLATPAESDQDHVPVVVANLPNIPDRQRAVRGEGPSPVPAMLASRDLLVSAGATCLAMPCNSAHVWFEELTQGLEVEFLHIVEAAQQALGGARTVGVVAAPATLRTRLYPGRLEANGVACLEPTPAEAKALAACIGRVKAGDMVGAVDDLRRPVEAQLDRGAEGVILACTELPLLLPHLPPDVASRCIDATDALAQACVRWTLAHRRVGSGTAD